MASIYENQVHAYGHRWYRPWLVIALGFIACCAGHWLSRPNAEAAPVHCDDVAGSRYRAAVEINGLVWTADIDAALACAFKQDRRILVAFHAIVDANARVKQINTFGDPRVQAAMRQYVLVMLYIDLVPDRFYHQKPDSNAQVGDGEANLRFERERFETAQEPMYVVLEPRRNGDFKIVAEYDEARLNDRARFIRFLRNPLAKRPETR